MPLLFLPADSTPPSGIGTAWTSFNLSTAHFFTYEADTYGQYADGVIKALAGNSPTFAFFGLEFDPAETYDVEFTFTVAEAGNRSVVLIHEEDTNASWEFGSTYQVYSVYHSDAVHTATIGPGIGQWNTAVGLGFHALVFEVGLTDEISSLRMRISP